MAEYQASFHGIYAHPNPPLRALEESIGQHMKAYGFTDVAIKVQPAEPDRTPDPECPNCANPPHEGECRRKGAAVREQEDTLLMRKRNASLLELLEAAREGLEELEDQAATRAPHTYACHLRAKRLRAALKPFDKILR